MLYAPSLQISLGTRYDYERLRVSSTPPLKLGRTRGGGGVVRRKRPRAFLWLANPRLVPLRGINIRSWCIGALRTILHRCIVGEWWLTDQEKVSGSQIVRCEKSRVKRHFQNKANPIKNQNQIKSEGRSGTPGPGRYRNATTDDTGAWGRGPGTLHRPNVPMWMRPLFAFFALLRFSSAARDDFSIAPAPSNDYWRLDGKTALVTGS